MIRLVVNAQELSLYNKKVQLYSDSIGFVRVHVTSFSADWNNLVKTAQFTQNDVSYNVVLSNDSCLVPAEISTGAFTISIFGNSQEGVQATTNSVELNMERSGFKSTGTTPIPPTPDLYSQLLSTITTAESTVVEKSAQVAEDREVVTQATEASSNEIAEFSAQMLTTKGEILAAKQVAQDSATAAQSSMLNGVTTHDTSTSAHVHLQGLIEEAKSIAQGRAQSRVFNTEEELQTWLLVPGNTDTLSIGDNLYIKDVSVSDYWWDGSGISKLEAESPALVGYYTKAEIDALVVKPITQSEYDALVSPAGLYLVVQDGVL